ncbi:MAG TPA: phage antirepressor N-terminal domain-containing protein [Ktedonobacterales bacterium]|jgi:hypothetical protein
MSETELIPVAQAELKVASVSLIAVLLPDGQTGAVLSMLCEALDLRTRSQAQKLRTHPVLSLALVLAKIETAGGEQVVNVLLSWGVPLWLASIRAGGRSPAYRERLLTMQREVAAALCRQFFSNLSTNTPTSSTSPGEPSETLLSSPWQALHAALSALEASLDADALAVGGRLAALEAQAAQSSASEHNHVSQERLLAAAIERLLVHERRLNRLKGRGPQKRRRGKARRFGR